MAAAGDELTVVVLPYAGHREHHEWTFWLDDAEGEYYTYRSLFRDGRVHIEFGFLDPDTALHFKLRFS